MYLLLGRIIFSGITSYLEFIVILPALLLRDEEDSDVCDEEEVDIVGVIYGHFIGRVIKTIN